MERGIMKVSNELKSVVRAKVRVMMKKKGEVYVAGISKEFSKDLLKMKQVYDAKEAAEDAYNKLRESLTDKITKRYPKAEYRGIFTGGDLDAAGFEIPKFDECNVADEIIARVEYSDGNVDAMALVDKILKERFA
jgi:hypothetical protein